MINKMDERRKWKNESNDEGKKRYKELNNELSREAAKAKATWQNRECNELEELDKKGRSDLVYDKVVKLTWKKKCMNKNIEIKDSTGVIVNEPEKVREQWRLYIESLCDRDGKPKSDEFQVEEEAEVEDDEKGPAVLRSEILAPIADIKEGKSAGVDEVPAVSIESLSKFHISKQLKTTIACMNINKLNIRKVKEIIDFVSL